MWVLFQFRSKKNCRSSQSQSRCIAIYDFWTLLFLSQFGSLFVMPRIFILNSCLSFGVLCFDSYYRHNSSVIIWLCFAMGAVWFFFVSFYLCSISMWVFDTDGGWTKTTTTTTVKYTKIFHFVYLFNFNLIKTTSKSRYVFRPCVRGNEQ